ncbi:hypothetical protein MOQ_003552 [Trypanosoma cruzi marinkellei]|uniref:Uncharacterized protein n=1 Tax=Trypanosoma cruzi marinkellei TaxID=85056 RepID=K2MZZ8_TRYCR|nr:hypothetical protein MOQ_003552 [Trypanosoma cruzi marinkellei]
MIEITAVPARSLTCPFPLVALDAAVFHETVKSYLLLLLVGQDRACVASLQDHKICLRRVVSQYHRTLTAGACRSMDSKEGHIFALADTSSTLTMHRVPNSSSGVAPVDRESGTVFVGNAWDRAPRIDQVVSIQGSSQADFVCTRQGEAHVAWTISFEREEARMIRIDGELERIFPQKENTLGCFVGGTPHGVSLISPATGEKLIQLKLPSGNRPAEAVQSGYAGNSYYYAVVTACGTALMYDQRRSEKPFWSKPLWDSHSVNEIGDTGTLMAYCCEGVWAVSAAERLHCLRCTDGSVVCRSFPLPEGFHSSQFTTAGLYFTNDVLHFVGTKRF